MIAARAERFLTPRDGLATLLGYSQDKPKGVIGPAEGPCGPLLVDEKEIERARVRSSALGRM